MHRMFMDDSNIVFVSGHGVFGEFEGRYGHGASHTHRKYSSGMTARPLYRGLRIDSCTGSQKLILRRVFLAPNAGRGSISVERRWDGASRTGNERLERGR